MPRIRACETCGNAYWEDRHSFGRCLDVSRKDAVLPAVVFRNALNRIATIRPAGDIDTARNTRALVEQMERIALDALAAATGTAKTPKAVECEASQSGPEGVTPNPSPLPPPSGEHPNDPS